MDYKKAYKEALERARKLHGGPDDAEIEEIFPELRESEDERIRRELLEYAKGEVRSYDNMVSGDYDSRDKEDKMMHKWWQKIVAYLEKQKEPIPIPDKFSELKSLLLQYLQSAANRKDDAEIEDDTDLWGRKILDYVWKQEEKQKEQKPAGWSEEDKRLLRTTLECLNYVSCQSKIPVASWLKSLPERFNLQPKQEWSEENSRKIAELKTFIAQCNGFNKANRQKAFDMIDALRPQPHWKPSEEQMRCLLDCVSKAKEIHNASVSGYDTYRILVSLYDELHKL